LSTGFILIQLVWLFDWFISLTFQCSCVLMSETLNQARAKALNENRGDRGQWGGLLRYGREEPARQQPSLALVAFYMSFYAIVLRQYWHSENWAGIVSVLVLILALVLVLMLVLMLVEDREMNISQGESKTKGKGKGNAYHLAYP
jgi:hypothetical protein